MEAEVPGQNATPVDKHHGLDNLTRTRSNEGEERFSTIMEALKLSAPDPEPDWDIQDAHYDADFEPPSMQVLRFAFTITDLVP